MYGAILGDMIGAPYEFDRSPKTKVFPLFSAASEFTDDSVMTVAVAEALLDSAGKADDEIRAALVSSMRKWGKRYPEAITAFIEGTDFEDVIRTAVSLGGDCDTLTCIAGSIAEAFYGIPDEMVSECNNRLPKDMLAVIDRFTEQKL